MSSFVTSSSLAGGKFWEHQVLGMRQQINSVAIGIWKRDCRSVCPGLSHILDALYHFCDNISYAWPYIVIVLRWRIFQLQFLICPQIFLYIPSAAPRAVKALLHWPWVKFSTVWSCSCSSWLWSGTMLMKRFYTQVFLKILLFCFPSLFFLVLL